MSGETQRIQEAKRILRMRGIRLEDELGPDFCLEGLPSSAPFWHVFGNLLQGMEEIGSSSRISDSAFSRHLERVTTSTRTLLSYFALLRDHPDYRNLQFNEHPSEDYLEALMGNMVNYVDSVRQAYRKTLPAHRSN